MISIREVCEKDWADMAKIYKQGIDSKKATFQEVVPRYEEWNSKYVDGCKAHKIRSLYSFISIIINGI
ncbi:hypothetical protein [uncultured Clostridium sp.]|uniref:hypothetical protein n=1 Tax=uncultured Clostridium sp. TaxID=59620 RepID=UPI00262AFA43|nr:hypothetical protein [uncultured Clostridium sp.]